MASQLPTLPTFCANATCHLFSRQFDRKRCGVWVHVSEIGIKRISGRSQGKNSFPSIKPTFFSDKSYNFHREYCDLFGKNKRLDVSVCCCYPSDVTHYKKKRNNTRDDRKSCENYSCVFIYLLQDSVPMGTTLFQLNCTFFLVHYVRCQVFSVRETKQKKSKYNGGCKHFYERFVPFSFSFSLVGG